MYDLIVLGAGPAGITATERAARLGAKVCLIDSKRAGGTDAVSGVVPARTLAHVAQLKRTAEQMDRYGIQVGNPKLDFAQALARCREVVDEVHASREALARKLGEGHNLTVLENVGDARFVDSHTIKLKDGSASKAEKFVICTGGHPRRPEFPGSEYALVPSDLWREGATLPSSAVIVGTGHTGVQIASILADFGCKVHLLARSSRLLPREDEDVSAAMRSAFEERGIEVITDIDCVKGITKCENGFSFYYEKEGHDSEIKCDAVAISAGWIPNTDGIGVTSAGVEINERGYIQVDDCLQTSQPHIYAAGDVTGRMMLVTAAMQEGYVAAGNALNGSSESMRHKVVSTGGFPGPEHGSVGLTEADARKAYDCEVAIVRYNESMRAIIDGETYGFCKLIVDRKSHLILGAHVVGQRAVEVVQLVAVGMATGLRVEQLAAVDLAYPTYVQIIGEAAYRACLALEIELHEVG